ncbi:hypothetical protein [Noviherbaspirillum cavernae]|uniref:hypothetical protein n=1 Tax=Noviherbaspirillum cavernae TaxID=2320862 RepID=UPI0011C34ABA|nr:hypothetical protein [Noviherbaspirillum cavernae]
MTNELLQLNHKLTNLELEYQKLISENIMLRLFYELDKCAENIALKLTRGVLYLDGSAPRLLIPGFRSVDAARQHMLQVTKKYYLEWTTLSKIQKNLNGILDPGDHFLSIRSLHDATYDDMRHVRNHIAHGSTSTQLKFSALSTKIFSASRGINPGRFLLSCKAAIPGNPPKDRIIVQYIRWSKVFIKTLTKSPI